MRLSTTSEKRLKRRAKHISIVEGGLSAGQSGFGDYFFVPFALELSPASGDLITGIISALQNLLAPLSEIFGNKLMKKNNRKSVITRFVFLQLLSFIFVIGISFLYWFKIWTGFLPLFLIFFISIYSILGSIIVPPWFSWMGDIVDEKERGRYFAYRNRIAGVVSIIASLIGAYILDYFKSKNLVVAGFVFIFILAMIFRYASYKSFKRKGFYEPNLKLKNGYYFSFFQFIKKMPKTNFGKFVIFVALINGAVALSSPFVTVFMLNDLKFDYRVFTYINLASAVATLLFLPLWGKFTDKFGNRKMMIFGGIAIPLVPILWIFSKSPYYLIWPSVFGGIVWGGFNLASTNFIYDSVKKEHRGLCVAYYSIVVGFAIFIGSLIGGVMLNYFPITFMNKYYFLFLVSGILRCLIAVIMLPMIKEVRRVKEISIMKLHVHFPTRESHYSLPWEHSFNNIDSSWGKDLERIFE